jgi:hypothetical protein
LKLRKLKFFDPIAQEQYRLHPTRITTKAGTINNSIRELSDPRTKGREVHRNEACSWKEALLRARLSSRKANDRAHLRETETQVQDWQQALAKRADKQERKLGIEKLRRLTAWAHRPNTKQR